MQLIKKIKQKLGLSNTELANYADISLSMMSMVESNQRQLPSDVNMILLQLFTTLEAIPKVEPPSQLEKDALKTSLNLLLQTEEQQKMIAEQALQNMQLKYKQATTTIALANAIQSSNVSEREAACLAAFKAKAQKKLEENNWTQQQLLLLKIKCIAYKINEINKLKQ